jgi:hypothetical protein
MENFSGNCLEKGNAALQSVLNEWVSKGKRPKESIDDGLDHVR